jgi:hypothetical protein
LETAIEPDPSATRGRPSLALQRCLAPSRGGDSGADGRCGIAGQDLRANREQAATRARTGEAVFSADGVFFASASAPLIRSRTDPIGHRARGPPSTPVRAFTVWRRASRGPPPGIADSALPEINQGCVLHVGVPGSRPGHGIPRQPRGRSLTAANAQPYHLRAFAAPEQTSPQSRGRPPPCLPCGPGRFGAVPPVAFSHRWFHSWGREAFGPGAAVCPMRRRWMMGIR